MAYQVIARKYRPQRFSDVVGQEHVTQTLANAIQQKRIAHAYLFCGPRGTGKTTIARIFAKCLNATGGPKVDFDDADPRCQEIAEGRSIDVLEIDGASNNGVEQVRELRETCKYAPAMSRFKIYIIDEVHMLTTAAFNALLKTLEEPPEHVKFMFATTDPEKVIPTILSRCQRYDLRRIPVNKIVQHLAHIARQEKTRVEEAALEAIARGAEGCMRDAESALDQLISFCGDKIVESDVLSMFGLTARSQVLALAAAMLQGQAARVLEQINELSQHGKDLGRLLSDLLNHFRNLLIYQVSGGDLKLLELTEAELAGVKQQAPMIDTEALTHVMEVLTEAETRLRDASSKKIFIEVSLLKAMQARQAVSIDTLLQELNKLRTGEGSSGSAQARPAPGTSKAAAPARPPHRSAASMSAPESGSFLAETPDPAPARESGMDLASLWTNLLEAVGRASPFTRSYLQEARPVSFVNNVLTIGFDPEFADQFELVNTSRTQVLLQTKLEEFGCRGAQVKLIRAEVAPPVMAPPAAAEPGKPAPQPPPAAAAAAKPGDKISAEKFKNEPLVRKALELFRGQIVEVRV